MSELTNLSPEEVKLFVKEIKEYSEYDFSEYSVKSFTRRIEKLLMDYNLDLVDLIEKFSNDKVFLEKIVKEITVNTTELFRDPEVWKVIRRTVLNKYSGNESIDVWHAGCSTGQEVFSMLILMKECGLFPKTNSYATDINTDVIDVSKSGKYKYREIDEYVNNFNAAFEESQDKPKIETYLDIARSKSLITVLPEIATKPVYTKYDLTKLSNPFNTKYDIIFCRNVLIYFTHELQNKIFGFFHDNLKPNGVLIIGRHEGILGDVALRYEKRENLYFKR